jgi:putative membrane protein
MNRLWLATFFSVLIWSGYEPKDRFTWFLEVAPALIGVVALWLTRTKFQLTKLLYVLTLIHCIILMIGGKYTYAEVPAFNWIRDTFGLARNHYDRVGHFAQGFIPAILAREILLRTSPLRRGKWLAFIVVCICLAFSAFYELIEWWVAALTGESAEAFLGTQGDPWDTQSDMMLALIGAMTSLAVLKSVHDRQLGRGRRT